MPTVKKCPRCKTAIECKVEDVTNCQCSAQNISNNTRVFLYRSGVDCHCNACLSYYDSILTKNTDLAFPFKKDQFIEGLHYYQEGNKWVFTEIYHLLRGHCCESNCRHCAYGYCEK